MFVYERSYKIIAFGTPRHRYTNATSRWGQHYITANDVAYRNTRKMSALQLTSGVRGPVKREVHGEIDDAA